MLKQSMNISLQHLSASRKLPINMKGSVLADVLDSQSKISSSTMIIWAAVPIQLLFPSIGHIKWL
jgi:hypothetical protein